MRRLLPRGVRFRLCVAFTLTSVAVTLGGSLLFMHVLNAGLASNLDNTLVARAQTISGALDGVAAPSLPDPLAGESSRGIAEATADTFAVVRRPSGVIVTATGAPAPHISLPASFRTIHGGQLVKTTLEVGGERYQVAALGVKRTDGIWLAISGASRRSSEETIRDLSKALLVAGPVLVLLVAVGSWVLAGSALRPVERMRRDAAAAAGTGRERLAVPDTDDELARLAVTLNELLERLGASLGRQQDLVADAGHELRTPLAILRTELELASRPGRSHAELTDAVEHAAIEVDRLSQLAEDLLFLARADGQGALVRPQPTDVASVLTASARSARAAADTSGVELQVEVEPTLTAVLDPGAVRRAIDNMLSNAIEYAPLGTVAAWAGASVKLTCALSADSSRLIISVTDTGPGFPVDFLPHAFDRFRRADPARSHGHGQRGAGLGLAVVREIAEAHGGSAEAVNLLLGGARVSVTLPCEAAPEASLVLSGV
jgi:two-component system OmpR family sensor kinase